MKTKLIKTDWYLIAIVNFVYLLFGVLECYSKGYSWGEYFIDHFSHIFFTLCVVLVFVYWLIPYFLIKRKHYFLFIFFALLILLLFGICDYTVWFSTGNISWSEYPNIVTLSILNAFRMTDMGGLILGILLTKKFYQSQQKVLEIEKLAKENELKLLRSQLDPHFLFNNLNTLDVLVDEDPKKAKEYINRLSSIYRYLIQTKDSVVMELSKELELAENYIFLIQTRFGSDYEFSFDIKSSIEDKFIPTGALQTLLENVVKHNKAIKDQIKTEIIVDENSIVVSNNKGNIKSETISFGTGLENLKIRYKNITENTLLIENSENEFRIQIPIVKLEDE